MVVLYRGGSLRHGGSLHYGGELFCEVHSAHRATVSPHSLIQTQTNKQTYATIHVRAHTRPLDVLTCFLARTFYIIRAASTQPQCVPAEKIGFAKTHKTASSTLQNIFLRWGLNQGWNFALLAEGSHLGPPNNQYVLDQPFQVICQSVC